MTNTKNDLETYIIILGHDDFLYASPISVSNMKIGATSSTSNPSNNACLCVILRHFFVACDIIEMKMMQCSNELLFEEVLKCYRLQYMRHIYLLKFTFGIRINAQDREVFWSLEDEMLFVRKAKIQKWINEIFYERQLKKVLATKRVWMAEFESFYMQKKLLSQSNEILSVGNTDIGSGRLDGNASEESHQIHKDGEITADQSESKHDGKIDENSGINPAEVQMHDQESKHEEKNDENSGSNPVEVHKHDLDKEHVEEVDQKSSSNHVEISAHDMCEDNEHVEKIDHVERIDQNSSRDPVKAIMQEMIKVCLVSGSVEKVEEEDSSKKDLEKEIAPKDNKDMEASDGSKLGVNGP
ncbi:hypothetical protein ACJX0J_016722, partial [Zea mays]